MALSPGKRCLGVCVMEDDVLILCGVRTFRGVGKERKASEYVTELIRDVQPRVLVMEKRTGNGESFAEKLYRDVLKIAKKQKIGSRMYSAEKVKQSLCGNEQATRYEVAQAVAEHHSELKQYQFDKGSEKEKYWRPMFLAVALAIVHGSTRESSNGKSY